MAQTIDTNSGQPIQPVTIVGASNSGSGAVNVDITQSDAIVPTDIQNHLTQSITAINAVALTITGGATPQAVSSAITCDGFNEISIVSLSSVSHAGQFMISWSFDNSTFSMNEIPGGDKILNAGTNTTRYGTIPVRAPYCKITFTNTDGTATPTVTTNAYLKA